LELSDYTPGLWFPKQPTPAGVEDFVRLISSNHKRT
jgi:hypothetical protein